MDLATIIAAAISAISAIVVCIITQNRNQMKLEAQLDKGLALINQSVDNLSKRVDKHNNVIERTYKLEELTHVQDEQIKVANHRIEDLEKICDRRNRDRFQNE